MNQLTSILKKISVLLIVIGPGFYFGLLHMPTEMGISVVSGSLAVAFINIDKIRKFKGAGFEAEMKEIKEVVNEAYATLEHLRQMAAPLIITTINTMTLQGRFYSKEDFPRKHEQQEELKNVVTLLSISDENVDKAFQKFHRYHANDIFTHFADQVNINNPDVGSKLYTLRNYDASQFPSSETIMSILGDTELSHDAKEWLEDYLFFAKHNKIRRPDAFKDD